MLLCTDTEIQLTTECSTRLVIIFITPTAAEMVNLFGYLWAMKLKEFRTPEQQKQDGLPEHATMSETSWIMALKPQAVAADYKIAAAYPGKSIQELQ